MQIPKTCPNCKGTKALLYFDAVYYYVVCDRCGMSGARSMTEEDAVTIWNERGETTFTYEVVQDSSKLVRVLSCDAQRVSKRFPINLPVVITLSHPSGKKVTGIMRNISPYGAFLQLKGGNLSDLPSSVEELTEKRVYVYYKNPVASSEEGEAPKNPIQQIELLPRHMLQETKVIGVGGSFKSPNAAQLESINTLVEYARNR